MPRRAIAACLTAAALLALSAAPSASAARKATSPTITRVLPMRLGVGDRLTIRGTSFNVKRTKNTVIFRAPSGRTAFAKPLRASRTTLVVAVPGAVSRLLSGPTRFTLRVLNGSFSKFTPRRLSPVIVAPTRSIGGGGGQSPGSGGGGDGAAPPAPLPVCDSTADHDGDLISNADELVLKTDPCMRDTDGDGVEDGFEFKSALDLNDDDFQDPNTSLPFPGKRHYPNPLDPSDAVLDFDGDVLTLAEEQLLWRYTIQNGTPRTLTPLSYSDGEQFSVGVRGLDGRREPTLAAAGYAKQTAFLGWASSNGYRTVVLDDGDPWLPFPTPPEQNAYGLLDMNRSGSEEGGALGYWFTETTYYDLRRDGWLSDNERDEDADGLINYDETHGRATPGFWEACYSDEKPFGIGYAGTDVTDPDSDGDGVLDGADDQDHDDIPNVMELSRNAASGLDDRKAQFDCIPRDGLPSPPAENHGDAYGRVNPFNPCLPYKLSRTCTIHPGIGSESAPFDGSLDWAALN